MMTLLETTIWIMAMIRMEVGSTISTTTTINRIADLENHLHVILEISNIVSQLASKQSKTTTADARLAHLCILKSIYCTLWPIKSCGCSNRSTDLMQGSMNVWQSACSNLGMTLRGHFLFSTIRFVLPGK
jgi:hypothetical protein